MMTCAVEVCSSFSLSSLSLFFFFFSHSVYHLHSLLIRIYLISFPFWVFLTSCLVLRVFFGENIEKPLKIIFFKPKIILQC